MNPKIMFYLILFLTLFHFITPTAKCKIDAVSGNQVFAKSFLIIEDGKIKDGEQNVILLRGFHYDCFYVLSKPFHDFLKQMNKDTDAINVELSRYYFSKKDIQNFLEMNANVVRIGLRIWQIEKEPYVYSKISLQHLDNLIRIWGENGIYVILDLHAAGQNDLPHNREYGNILWGDSEFQNRVLSFWKKIADRYKDNYVVAGYDIINEPKAPTNNTLNQFYTKLISGIREVDKNHLLFLERNLIEKKKIAFGGEYTDNKIIHSFHFYKPGAFTTQNYRGREKGLKYPGTYGKFYWDRVQIDRYFKTEVENIKEKPIYIGEFSAPIWTVKNDSLLWTKDVIEVMNKYGLHYTYFPYKFLVRTSHGLFIPKVNVKKEMKRIENRIAKDIQYIDEIMISYKKLYGTDNFDFSNELIDIIKEGFSN